MNALARAADWFEHPMFAGIRASRDLFFAPEIEALDRAAEASGIRFAEQTPALLADGLHYEARIAASGLVATRPGVHDRFNALVWLGHAALKRAMNARQVADIARVGPKQRTRGQCALTHFDEAGAIVWIDGDDLVDAWNAHDWHALFARHRDAWGSRIALTVVGHALYEYAFEHGELPVAKALAVRVEPREIERRSKSALIASWPDLERRIADAVASGRLLADPQELRPLPFAGIPGWHAGPASREFFEATPCFRPVRAGRRYPEPAELGDRNA
ncbi:MAG: DUF3025 domain-containing protein [Rhodanobacteraceae bacterium]